MVCHRKAQTSCRAASLLVVESRGIADVAVLFRLSKRFCLYFCLCFQLVSLLAEFNHSSATQSGANIVRGMWAKKSAAGELLSELRREVELKNLFLRRSRRWRNAVFFQHGQKVRMRLAVADELIHKIIHARFVFGEVLGQKIGLR